MADYQDIRGLRVKYLSADPSVTVGGEVWYNSTTGALKSQLLSEAWSSSAPLNAPMTSLGQGTGIQTAALAAGGHPGSPPYPLTNTSSEYNGSGWAAGGTLNTAGNSASQANNGTQTAALIWGRYVGGPSTASEEYDGTSWTTGNARSVGNYRGAGGGTQTAAFATGGYPPSSTAVEEYDGTNWTAGGALPAGRQDSSGAGTQTAGIVMGGDTGPPSTIDLVQTYDGSSWTTVTAMPTERQEHGGVGLQTAALVFGGMTGPGAGTAASVTSASYDGTNWTAGGSLATGRQEGTNAGTSTLALFAGGTPTPAYNLTEEYNVSQNVITAGAWASGGNMNTGRRGICSAKNAAQDAALGALGYVPPNPPGGEGTAHAETYDGSTWTNITSVPTGRYFGGGFGTQGSAVICGGYSTVPSAGQKDITNEWNGSAWSLGGTLPTGQSNFAADGCGTETAGLVAGGIPGPYTITAEYDGSTWTTVPGSLNTPRTGGASFGVQTAAIAATGDVPAGYPKDSESYDGTSWTSTNPTLYGGYGAAAAGTQTAGLLAGNAPPGGTTSQTWDGTNWSTNPSYTTARFEMGGTGSSTAALGFSGATSGPTVVTNATEEFTGATSAANIVTLTTS